LERTPFQGRVVNHAGHGIVIWVDRAGRETEESQVTAENRIFFRVKHGAAEHVVYISDQRPLTVVPMPLDWQGTSDLVLTLPASPVRSFRISAPAMKASSGLVGLWIGGLYVPVDTLAQHQEMRGKDVRIPRGQSLEIKDIAETAPIAVAVAPEGNASGDFVDPFTTPAYSGVPRQPVRSMEVVIP
jgi:hypothetical protein